MDEQDVGAMLFAEQEQADHSMQYEEDEQYHQHQYGDEDVESEEDFGFIQPEWPLVLTVDDVRSHQTKALSTIEEVRSSVGSRSQASQSPPAQVQLVAFHLFPRSLLYSATLPPNTLDSSAPQWVLGRLLREVVGLPTLE
jgi:hypothetical protein